MSERGPKSLILFDGVCNLCSASVNFIINRDPHERFEFAPLQSPLGQKTLAEHGLSESSNLSTMVLIEDDRCFTRSSAAPRVARHLKFPWPMLYITILIPRFLRDAFYNWIARNRYRWFGKRDACRMPTPELASRFRSEIRGQKSQVKSTESASLTSDL